MRVPSPIDQETTIDALSRVVAEMDRVPATAAAAPATTMVLPGRPVGGVSLDVELVG